MLLGLPPIVFIHTLISLVALVAGIVVVFDLVKARARAAWVSTFLVTAVATSATGFILPADRFLPSHATGIIALIVLAVALAGRYAFNFAGAWRWIYAVRSLLATHHRLDEQIPRWIGGVADRYVNGGWRSRVGARSFPKADSHP